MNDYQVSLVLKELDKRKATLKEKDYQFYTPKEKTFIRKFLQFICKIIIFIIMWLGCCTLITIAINLFKLLTK